MSLPLTRRIAKTVLLTAAGAASVVGTTGAASAAELPSTADVGGLSNLDTPLDHSVDGARSTAEGLTPKSTTSTLDKSAPKVQKAVIDDTRSAAPGALSTADKAAGNPVSTVGQQVPAVPGTQLSQAPKTVLGGVAPGSDLTSVNGLTSGNALNDLV